MSGDFGIQIENFPVGGSEAVIRTVGLGVGSATVILIEIDPNEDDYRVTVGNGPANSDFASMVPAVLRQAALDIEDGAEQISEYLEQRGAEIEAEAAARALVDPFEPVVDLGN